MCGQKPEVRTEARSLGVVCVPNNRPWGEGQVELGGCPDTLGGAVRGSGAV